MRKMAIQTMNIWPLLVLLLLCGCSYTSIEVKKAELCPYNQEPTLVVGLIQGATEPFYEELFDELGKVQGLELVREADGAVPCNGARLYGSVDEDLPEEISWDSDWDENFWRVVGRKTVGMGAGKTTIRGEFRLTSHQGEELLHFVAVENYAGGSGTGGFLDGPAMLVGGLRYAGEAMMTSLAFGVPLASSPLPYPHDFIGYETLLRRLGDESGEVVGDWFRGRTLKVAKN